ncbi:MULTISPECIES: DUF1097 domain-containing protein [Sporosarcina]|uniref:DUF1097 domain-containing protein n=1 Tax=Sporosarcina TaxID=1569 RepID=UPI00058E1210|nr:MULTISPECIES: DUF1097 domain-containing protein [Sporosarcina]WJY27208.1 DUF1097 domain-containing protein [Sporosarcina sp. 0.2-SM1T-5]
MKSRIPKEVVASLLAATTVLLALPPFNLPPWALFIGWAGTFAAGGPNSIVMKKIWITMPIGSLTAAIIVLVKDYYFGSFLSGGAYIAAEMGTIFFFNCLMMLLGRTRWFPFVPGMFFGFASFFATYYGGWGPVDHSVWSAFIAVVFMNAMGPIYAWLTENLSAGTVSRH